MHQPPINVNVGALTSGSRPNTAIREPNQVPSSLCPTSQPPTNLSEITTISLKAKPEFVTTVTSDAQSQAWIKTACKVTEATTNQRLKQKQPRRKELAGVSGLLLTTAKQTQSWASYVPIEGSHLT